MYTSPQYEIDRNALEAAPKDAGLRTELRPEVSPLKSLGGRYAKTDGD